MSQFLYRLEFLQGHPVDFIIKICLCMYYAIILFLSDICNYTHYPFSVIRKAILIMHCL